MGLSKAIHVAGAALLMNSCFTCPAASSATSVAIGATEAFAFTYYVDSAAGSDKNPGSLASPWKTIAKVNATGLAPGQSVGFKRGGVWRAALVPKQSGAPGAPITFGAYGDEKDPNPIIDGADIVSAAWVDLSGAVNGKYEAPVPIRPYVVVFDGLALGTPKTDIDSLQNDRDWYWDRGALYIYSTSDPADRTIESGSRSHAISANGLSYITISNFTVRGTNGRAILVNRGSNWFIENNIVELTSSGASEDGSGSIATSNATNVSVTHNIIRNTWNDGIYMWYPKGAIISDNLLSTNDGLYSDNIQISGGTNVLVQNNTADQHLVKMSEKGNIILMLGTGNSVVGNTCVGGLYAVTSDEDNLIVTSNHSSGHTEPHSFSFGMAGKPTNQLWAYNVSIQEHVGFYGYEGPYNDMKLYYNVVYDPSASGLEVDDTTGSFSGELTHNVFYGPDTKVIWNINRPGAIVSDFNVIGPDKPGDIFYNWVYYNNLASYVNVYGQDAHSQSSWFYQSTLPN